MKILVVDDEDSIVDLLKMNLEMERYEVVTAYNGEEALMQFELEKPDIVLLDISLQDMEGYDVLRQMKKLNNGIPIMLVTARNQINSKILGLQIGADDYLIKPFDLQELILRIRVIVKHIYKNDPSKSEGSSASDRILTINQLQLYRDEMKVLLNNQEVALTYKEFKVLWFLCANKGRIFDRDQLIEKIWGFDYIGNSRAVDILIARLRKKADPMGEHIKTVYGAGYKYEE